MRFSPLALALVTSSSVSTVFSASYELSYSHYLGGEGWDHVRDAAADADGNVYVVGGTGTLGVVGPYDQRFPVTPTPTINRTSGIATGNGQYNGSVFNRGVDTVSPKPNATPPGVGGAYGNADAFITKYSPTGAIIWSTFLGGPNYDRAYAVELDSAGNVYVGGRAGTDFPTTVGAMQTDFFTPESTNTGGSYGLQNGFVAKLNSSGNLQWASYFGRGELVRDLALDTQGNIFVPLTVPSTAQTTDPYRQLPAAFDGKMIDRGGGKGLTPGAGADVGLAKIKNDGSGVIWATWLGGNKSESTNPSIRVDPQGRPIILFDTPSTGLQVGGGGTTYGGGLTDVYVAKLTADGTSIVYGTYLGGAGDEEHETHSLAVDSDGNAYAAIVTSGGFPVTQAGPTSPLGGGSDIAIVKIAADSGVIVRSTVIGGSSGENPDGVYVDANGRIFIVAETKSTDFPMSKLAQQTGEFRQTVNAGNWDGLIMVLSADMTTIEYATYFGGTLRDVGSTAFLGVDGSIYAAGGTLSTEFPSFNPLGANTTFNGGTSGGTALNSGDAWLAKFSPLSVPEPTSPAIIVLGGILLSRRNRRSELQRRQRWSGVAGR